MCCFYSFLGNAVLIGIAPYITLYAQEFGVNPTQASNLVSYPNLAYGFGSLLLVPSYLKFGRRPVMLGSMAIVCSTPVPPRHSFTVTIANTWIRSSLPAS